MNQMAIVSRLIDRGWISLRQLGILLETPDRSIYGRQRTRNPVQTIRIGGTERVYLECVKSELRAQGRIYLVEIINTAIKNKEREDAKSLRITERGN